MPDQVERCRAAGMNDHLAKPIDRAQMLAVIEKWLNADSDMEAVTASVVGALPVIDEEVACEIEGRLDRPQFQSIIAAFREQLDCAETSLATTNEPLDVEMQAHAMVSISGAMGFAQLLAASRAAMNAARANSPQLDSATAEFAMAIRAARTVMDARYPVEV
jgi:hypothetical protein